MRLLHRFIAVLLAVVLGSAATADEALKPVVRFIWEPGTAPKGAHAPALVPFLEGHGLQCTSAKKTEVNLTDSPGGDRLRITGALSITATIQLAAQPRDRRPLLSKWNTHNNRRSYELGIDDERRLYLSISASGAYDRRAKELFSSRQLEVGVPYAVTAVFDPGKCMAITVNGARSGWTGIGVPSRIHDNDTPVLLGARPPGVLHINAIVGSVQVYDKALTADAITSWVKRLGLTKPPGPEVLSFEEMIYAPDQKLPPVRAITRGPKFHWFAYYDKMQMDATGRYVLGMEADFECRSPTPDDVIKIGMIDLQDGDRWIQLGESRAWCWQQGCMLQWRPGHPSEVLWNDRQGDRFVCHILDVKTGKKRTLPRAIYHVSPDGKWAVCTDFRRVQDMRPGYGYPGISDPNKDVMAPDDSGVWLLDLETGEEKLLVTIADIAKIPDAGADPAENKHYFNHLQWSPDGKRFLFLNRWRSVGKKKRSGGTRMFTAHADGSDVRLVSKRPGFSHFVWRDPEHILVWAGGAYRLYKDDGLDREQVLWKAPNGHQSYLPGNEWLITDTYPMTKRREQNLYLYHLPTNRITPLGHFPQPRKHGGEWRCDLHPRLAKDGTAILFDSTHEDNGRQMYLIDISRIVGKPNGEGR